MLLLQDKGDKVWECLVRPGKHLREGARVSFGDGELTAEIAENLTYCGDEYAVRQLVSILLDNAVKYAVPNTPIAVSLEKTRKGVVLRTKNHCDPALADETGKLFDRFYRADPSRNAESGGFGIGLSIARGIAEGHRGTIGAKCVGDVIEFTVELR